MRTNLSAGWLRQPWRLALVLIFVFCLGSITLAQTRADDNGRVDDGLPAPTDLNAMYERARSGGVRVIVQLNMEAAVQAAGLRGPAAQFDAMTEPVRQQMIASAQSAVLASLGRAATAGVKQYRNFPLLALTVDAAGLDALRRSPYVAAVIRDGFSVPHLAESTVQIGAAGENGAWAQGYTGAGQAIAIIDTGVDKNHPMLDNGKVVAEGCWGTSGSDTLIPGVTYSSAPACPDRVDSSTEIDSALPCDGDGCDHGTHVAAIAAGDGGLINGVALRGVAPDAEVIAVQAFSLFSGAEFCQIFGFASSPCAVAYNSDVIAGMDWVYSIRAQHNIAAVNLSLGSSRYYNPEFCEFEQKEFATAVKALTDAGIAVIASSGNDGYTDALSAPACIDAAISVGSVGETRPNDNGQPVCRGGANANPDAVSGFSNVAYFLDLYAPGCRIVSATPDDTYTSISGTSQAAPHVAGAWAVLQQVYRDSTGVGTQAPIRRIERALEESGRKITYAGVTTPRIRLDRALPYLVFPAVPILIAPEPATGNDPAPVYNAPGMDFTWSTGPNTDLYVLQVFDASDRQLISQQIPADQCSAESCSYRVDDPLTSRSLHRWQVIARNENNRSRSEEGTFYVEYPGAPVLESPNPGLLLNDPSQLVTMSWSVVPEADPSRYRVMLIDTRNNRSVYNQPVDASALNCDTAVCNYTVPDTLRAALRDRRTYEWRVQAANEFGRSRSDKREFRTDFPAAPGLNQPGDNLVLHEPGDLQMMSWSEAAYAARYRVIVRETHRGRSSVIFRDRNAQAICNAGTCSYIVPLALQSSLRDDREYTWWVQAVSDYGRTPSARRTFRTQFPAQPTLQTPANNGEINRPAALTQFVFSAADGATTYRISVWEVRANRRVQIFRRTETPGGALTCTTSTCTYAVPNGLRNQLRDGFRYEWRVQARSSYGRTNSALSGFRTRFPGKPVLQSPRDGQTVNLNGQPLSLQWSNDVGADFYHLTIIDTRNGRLFYQQRFSVSDTRLNCSSASCTFTFDTALMSQLRSDRRYRWKVRADSTFNRRTSDRFTFEIP